MLIKVVLYAERVRNRLDKGLTHIITRILGLVLEYILNGMAGFCQGLVGR